jgi:uncharacterized protein (DUF885 family)
MTSASAALQALFAEDFAWELQDNPEYAFQAGQFDVQYAAGKELQNVSPQAFLQRKEHSALMLQKMKELRAKYEFVGTEKIHCDLFVSMHEDLIAFVDTCPMYLLPINSMGYGAVTNNFLECVEWMRFETISDFNKYLATLKCFDTQMDQFIEALREGIRQNIIQSKDVAKDVIPLITSIIEGPLEELYAPLNNEASAAVINTDAGLKQAITEAIEATRESFKKLMAFYTSEYQPKLREGAGLCGLSNGAEMYKACLKYHTTTEYTPDEIHNIGLKEVAAIEERYKNDVMIPLGFDPEKFVEFVEYARNDKQYYVSTPEQLLEKYHVMCDKIAEIMPNYFKEIPKSPLEMLPKQGGPAAYYLAGTADGKRPGRFYVNVSHIEKRPLYECVALSLHEAIPGHHHQIALALENDSLPWVCRG